MGIRSEVQGRAFYPLDFGNILLNVLIMLVLTISGSEAIKRTLEDLRQIKIRTLLTVLFLFSALSLVPVQ